ncbi:MAG: hypothetical protein INH41_26395 [Myxococcaceae bacterium]|jgi:hypothetical protein|nr:hypothetical protein [Myxococcaceae bacterium]
MRRALPLVVTVLVGVPSLRAGFVLDDWIQRAVVRGHITFTTPLELFSFGSGDAVDLAPLIRLGPFPWFTQPDLKLRFLRPLSSALIWLDTTLFGDASLPQHLHSLLWSVALTALAMLLYQRLMPPLAVAAGCFFALDDAHALPTMWLANRNALVAAAFAFLALWLHLRWRDGGSRWLSVGAVVSAAVGLCAGETAVACLAYVVAFELVGREGPLRLRVWALAPMSALLAGYAVVYKLTASGARGSATYVDPVSEPLEFLVAAPVRFLVNVGAQTFGLPDLWLTASPAARVALVGLGALALPVWWLAWRRWAPGAPEARRTLRWLALGAVLSVLPGLAAFPAARLLTGASLGLAAVVAALLDGALRDGGLRRAAGLAWGLWCFGGSAALSWLAMSAAFAEVGARTTAAVRALEPRPGERFVVVSSTEFATAIYAMPVIFEERLPAPASWHVWSMAQASVELWRTANRQVELRTIDGEMLESLFEQNFRNPSSPVPEGLTVALEGQRVTVLERRDGRPVRLRVDLERPAADFSFVWWNGERLERLELPAVGARRVLPRVPTILERVLLGPAAWGERSGARGGHRARTSPPAARRARGAPGAARGFRGRRRHARVRGR